MDIHRARRPRQSSHSADHRVGRTRNGKRRTPIPGFAALLGRRGVNGPISARGISSDLPSGGEQDIHWIGRQESYLSAAGTKDLTERTSAGAYPVTTEGVSLIDRVQVRAPRAEAEIVALGDSITDGVGASTGAESSWPEALSRRLRSRGLPWVLGNAGISGDTLSGIGSVDGRGGGLNRLERDVFSFRDGRDLIVLEGINDLQAGESATTVIDATKVLIRRAESVGFEIQIGTLLPSSFLLAVEGGEERRLRVNRWIRSQDMAPAIDWDRALRDPNDRHRIRPALSSDGLHPNDTGYLEMANAFNPGLLPAAGCGSRR